MDCKKTTTDIDLLKITPQTKWSLRLTKKTYKI